MTNMKIKKSVLKQLVKECVKEVIREDKALGRALVKEAIIDIFGDKILMREAAAPRRTQRRPRSTNVPAIMSGRTNQLPVDDTSDEPTDLFEALAADTMMNTLPAQVAKDRTNPMSRSWESMIADPNTIDEGPAMHLNRAKMMPDSNGQHKQAIAAEQAMTTRSMMSTFNQSMHTPVSSPVPAQQSPIGEPSQGQLMEMYRAQQAVQRQPAPSQQPTSHVPDDLAALGLGGKTWDAHIDAQPAQLPQNPSLDPNLAAIAASTNAEFTR